MGAEPVYLALGTARIGTDMAEFKDGAELQTWLEKQPRAVSVVIAARAVLRVLPLLAIEFSAGRLKQQDAVAGAIALPVFRAMAVSWTEARYPDHGMDLVVAAIAAATAANAAAAAAANAAAANAVAVSAVSAARAVSAADATAARAAYAAAAANTAVDAADAAEASWQVVRGDAARIENGMAPDDLAGEALWTKKTPDWFHSHWERLKLKLQSLDLDWEGWIYWYEARRDGRLTYRASPKVNEQIDIARATIDDEIWRQGPAAVFAEIKRLEKEILGGKEPDWDFFLSYSADDEGTARKIAAVVEGEGYSVFSQFQNMPAGANFVREMQKGLAGSSRFIAVLLSKL